ncbi:uncharacterized protein [Ptychodera flava]|uniref:uncharacterized protein n=1 Tax=Ptychodera flava TaxID=63121 RepID=UPI00396A0C7F
MAEVNNIAMNADNYDIEEDPYFYDSTEDENEITVIPSQRITRIYTLPAGYILKVPPGSAKQGIQFTVFCETNNSIGPPLKDFEFRQSDVIRFKPNKVMFDNPVFLTRKRELWQINRDMVIMISDDGTQWEELPTFMDSEELSVSVSRLTMFIAITRPHKDMFSIDEGGANISSETDKQVVLDIPEAAVDKCKSLSLEVHVCDSALINDVFEDKGNSIKAAFSPMVYLNTGDTKHVNFRKPVKVNIPLPTEMSQIVFPDLKSTEVRILADKENNGNWKDVTNQASFTCENGLIKLERETFSGYSAVRVQREDKDKAAGYCKAITKYTRDGNQRVKILLLQHTSDKQKILMDIVEQRGQKVELLYKRMKLLRKKGYRPYYDADLPYSEDVRIRSGDTICNEVSEGFVLRTRKNRKAFYQGHENHWFAYVEPLDAGDRLKSSAVGFMIFYRDRESSGIDDNNEREPLAELQFVLPKVNRPKSRRPSTPVTQHFDLRERRKLFQCLAGKTMSHEWKNLARTLGLDECEIDEIEYAYPRDKPEQVYKMLLCWENTLKDKTKSIPTLVKGLQEAGLPWLVAELKQRFPELYKSK